MTKQEYVDFLKNHGAKIHNEECDSYAVFDNYEIMLACVPTDDNGKVIEDFDFTPFATDEKPAAYLSRIKIGNDVVDLNLISEMPLLYAFED